MSWIGQHGMWNSESEADADELAVRTGQYNSSIKQWKAHSEKLQNALDDVSAMYRLKVGDERAQGRIKDLALAEIEKLDPKNKLLDQNYRKQIGDKVREETARELNNK